MKDKSGATHAVFDENCNLQEEKEGILDSLLRYNQKLLSREEHSAKFQELFQLKCDRMNTVMDTKISKFNTITEECQEFDC